jgi:hypothetical protein
MAGKSDYLENKILNYIFNGGTFTAPTTVYVGLYTSAPTDAGGGTEVSGGSYARVAITCNTTNFPTTSDGQIENAVAQNFAQASAGWGTVVAFGIFDALTSGNLLYWGTVSPSKTVAAGDTLSIAINQLQISED